MNYVEDCCGYLNLKKSNYLEVNFIKKYKLH